MKSVRTYRGKKTVVSFSVRKALLETTFDRLLGDTVCNRSKVFESSSEAEKKKNGCSTNTSNESEPQASMDKPKFFIYPEKEETPVDIVGLLQDSSLSEKGSGNVIIKRKKKKTKKTNNAKKRGIKKLTHFDRYLDSFVKKMLSNKELFASTPIKPKLANQTNGKFTVTIMSPILRDHEGFDSNKLENIAPGFRVMDSVLSPFLEKSIGASNIPPHSQKKKPSFCSGSLKTNQNNFETIEDKLESMSLSDSLFQTEQKSDFFGFTSKLPENMEALSGSIEKMGHDELEKKSISLMDDISDGASFYGFDVQTYLDKDCNLDRTLEKYKKLEQATSVSYSPLGDGPQTVSVMYKYPILMNTPPEPLDEVRLLHNNITMRRKKHYEKKRAEMLRSSLLVSTPLMRKKNSHRNENDSSLKEESRDKSPTPVGRSVEHLMESEVILKSDSFRNPRRTFTVRDFPVYRPGAYVSLDEDQGSLTHRELEPSPSATLLSGGELSPVGQCDGSADMFAESAFSPPVSNDSCGPCEKSTSPATDEEEEERAERGDALFELGQRVTVPGGKKYRRSLFILHHLAQGSLREADPDDLLPPVERGRLFEQSVCQVIQLQNRGGKNSICPSIRINETVSRNSIFISSPFKNSMRQSIFIQSPRISICPRRSERRRTSLRRIPGVQGEDYYKDRILSICDQKSFCSFETLAGSSEPFASCSKIGEGVFGEVFVMKRNSRRVVLKIIPIEGSFLVNGEPQKKYSEVYSELVVAHHLHKLREGDEHRTEGFAELSKSWLVEGKYPTRLVQLWDEFDQKKGSENDSPVIFPEHQLFLVLELGHAGTDLANYTFSNAKQALSVFQQVATALAVAEEEYKFEHRDLHWGNVLISRTGKKFINFSLNGETYKIKTAGVKGTIIDFTLSSMTVNGERIFNDVGKDPEMFIASGDYQFDIYRHMKDDLDNDWKAFVPKTNVRWLHYLVDKLIRRANYLRTDTKVHQDSIDVLKEIETWLLDCSNCVDVALNIIDL